VPLATNRIRTFIQIRALTDYDAALGLDATDNTFRFTSRANRVPPTGIFAYLLAANAQRAASGASDRPKVALAILAIDANSWWVRAHHTRADWIGV
jgi:hypothetical protein